MEILVATMEILVATMEILLVFLASVYPQVINNEKGLL